MDTGRYGQTRASTLQWTAHCTGTRNTAALSGCAQRQPVKMCVRGRSLGIDDNEEGPDLDKLPFDPPIARELFEDNRPDEFGLDDKSIPIVISGIAFLDEKKRIAMRLQTEEHPADPAFDCVLTPYAAVRLSHALAAWAREAGAEHSIKMEVRNASGDIVGRVPHLADPDGSTFNPGSRMTDARRSWIAIALAACAFCLSALEVLD